ncbi:MAG: DUF5989 family protein [Phycisphaerae bacterium]
MTEPDRKAEAFQREAQADRVGLLAEFWDFLKHNKKWWLLPILIMMLLLGVLVVSSGSALGPLIYAL